MYFFLLCACAYLVEHLCLLVGEGGVVLLSALGSALLEGELAVEEIVVQLAKSLMVKRNNSC